MDGAEDALASGSQLAQEPDDIEGALAIETRRRLVEEEQQLGLGRELDADRETLTRLNRQAKAGEADESVGKILELAANVRGASERRRSSGAASLAGDAQQLKNLLNVVVLLLLADVEGLAQVGRVAEGLADGRRPLVNAAREEQCDDTSVSSGHAEMDAHGTVTHSCCST
jgi:hypothetical protein